MAEMNRICALGIIAIFALSIMLMVESANAQSIPKPTVPEFTLQLAQTSELPPISWGHPYNNDLSVKKDTDSYYTIELKVKNQHFTPFKEYMNGGEKEISLTYNVRLKINNSQNWITVYSPEKTGPASTTSDLIIPFSIQQSLLNDTETTSDGFYIRAYYVNSYSYSNVTNWIPEGQVQISFQVQALMGYLTMIRDNPVTNQWVWVFKGQTSDWSPTQTITIGEESVSPTPSPTVPEFPITITLIAVLATVSLMLVIGKRKQGFNN